MLNNPVAREGIKALSQAVVTSGTGDPSIVIGSLLVGVLGVSVEALGYLGAKRSNELFDTQDLIDKVANKIRTSDDFSGFVFSVWQKHNLESSEERRRMLKRLLEHETLRDVNEFENFSKIEYILQNANLRSLKLLSIIHSDVVQKREIDENNGASRLLNMTILQPLIQSVMDMHVQDIGYFMNELGSYGLIDIRHGTLGGPYFNETKLGYVLLDYIQRA